MKNKANLIAKAVLRYFLQSHL